MYVEALYTVKHKIGRTIDGHSDYMTDPYCMLGIVPGSRAEVGSDENSENEDENHLNINQGRRKSKTELTTPVKTGFLRRLSTLRKGEKTGSSKSSKSSKTTGVIRDGKLPAKYIQTTDVKKATLNPVWFEKFRL